MGWDIISLCLLFVCICICLGLFSVRIGRPKTVSTKEKMTEGQHGGVVASVFCPYHFSPFITVIFGCVLREKD
jgi:hypothetical protein